MVKNLSAMQDRDLGSILGQEDPQEKGMATHSSILACEVQWSEEPGRLQFTGQQESVLTERLAASLSFVKMGHQPISYLATAKCQCDWEMYSKLGHKDKELEFW